MANESIIKKRGMEQWQRQTPKEEQYKQIVSKMPPEEQEHERKLRVQEKKGMSEWHAHEEGKIHPFSPRKKYETEGIREQYAGGKEESRYFKSPREQEELNRLMSELKGKDREEVEARLRGYKSAAERKEVRTRIGRETQAEAEKRYYEQTYEPAERFRETVGEVKYKLGVAKEAVKKLATPAGFAGGIIGAIAPKMTKGEKIKAEQEAIRKEEYRRRRRELMEKRQHEVAVAAAYSGIRPTKEKIKSKQTASQKFLGGFGTGAGGFSLGGERPVARPIVRSQRRVEQIPVRQPISDNPFGLNAGGIASPSRPQVQPTREKYVPVQRTVVRTEIRPATTQGYNPVNNPQATNVLFGGMNMGGKSPVSSPRPRKISSNPVSDTSANFLVGMEGNVKSPVSMKKKKSVSNGDTTGASAYWR